MKKVDRVKKQIREYRIALAQNRGTLKQIEETGIYGGIKLNQQQQDYFTKDINSRIDYDIKKINELSKQLEGLQQNNKRRTI